MLLNLTLQRIFLKVLIICYYKCIPREHCIFYFRAPMGLYMHAAWFNKSPEMLDAFEFWIDEILSTYNNVFFVTMNDVLKFMQQPFPIRYCLLIVPYYISIIILIQWEFFYAVLYIRFQYGWEQFLIQWIFICFKAILEIYFSYWSTILFSGMPSSFRDGEVDALLWTLLISVL